jgi:uncharacterized protein (DUF58 family)
LSGIHKSPYKGFSVEFADHREYVPGDDVRHIDWRLYGKADRYYIKEYEVETNLRTHILLDGSESMSYPEHDDNRMTKWQYGSTLAASIAHLLVHQQDGVGLVVFDEAISKQLPVSSSRATLPAWAQVLEAHKPANKTNMELVFGHLAERIPRRGMVVIVSDLLTNVDNLLAGLQRFRFLRHDVLVLQVLDHDELEFPFTDNTLFEGMEGSTLELLTDPQSLRSSYIEALQAFISRVRSACLNHGIQYVLVDTADPMDVVLTTFLTDRMHRLRSTA